MVIDSLCIVGFTDGPLGMMTIDGLIAITVVLLGLGMGFVNAIVINSSHVVDFIEGLMGKITGLSGTVNQTEMHSIKFKQCYSMLIKLTDVCKDM